MSVPKYRLDAIETIGRKILQEYDPALLDGPPQAVPIETIIETKFDLTLEYHCLRKNGSILGETIFDEGAAILYDQDEKRYRLIAVKAGTILVEERLCVDRLLGRLRFTCAHELGHWVLHQKLYSGTGDVAAYEGKTSLDESYGLVEWQADALATALLMPLPQIKRSFYRLRAGRSHEHLVAEMARTFQVSKQAMRIGWKHAISYKFGTASPLLLREGRSRSAVRRLCCMHFVRSLANKEGGEWHEEIKRHCAEMQKTDGDPWI